MRIKIVFVILASLFVMSQFVTAQEPALTIQETPVRPALGTISSVRMLAIHNPGPAVTVSADGEVLIDWEAVDKYVQKPPNDQRNMDTTLAILRALVAVRDGTWKPIVR